MGASIQLREVFSLPAFFPDDLGLGPGPREPCEGAGIGGVGAIGVIRQSHRAVWDADRTRVCRVEET